MKKIYAEIGFGNESFYQRRLRGGTGEYRIPIFIRPSKIKGLYFRFWIFKKVFILSTNHGFEIVSKNRNRLKILFGIAGEN